jgi:NAD(P)-dependent dehydrogenase (short-subunit alcohol dehydrogenase family)
MIWPLVLAVGLLLAAWWLVRLIRTRRYSLKDRVVFITGGSRGLGLAIAREVCAQGGKVALLARDPDELNRAKMQLMKEGGEVLTLPCDLLDAGQIHAAIEQSIQCFGKIDILINNAGIIEVGPFDHMKVEDFDRAMRLHLWAPFVLTLQIVPQMRKQGGGRIVNISSIGGKIAVPHMAPYSASKFALTGFSDAIRAELSRDKIHVTTVTPGMMRTGSQVHAKFKGDHSAEYKWFDLSSKLPFASISAERAARKILAASRRGQPALIMPLTAYFIIAANAVFPNLTGYVMKLVNALLPARVSASGDEALRGSDIRDQS